MGTGFSYDRDDATVDHLLGNIKNVLKECRGIRRAGSAALDMCYVAKGSLTLYYEHAVHAWDIAGGCIIVQEAGGVVANMYGDAFDVCQGQVLVGNATLVAAIQPHLHKKL